MQSAQASSMRQQQSRQDGSAGRRQPQTGMDSLIATLDMNNQADMLLATPQELLKINFRDSRISANSINRVYQEAAALRGLAPRSAYEMLTRELDGVTHFKTGAEE